MKENTQKRDTYNAFPPKNCWYRLIPLKRTGDTVLKVGTNMELLEVYQGCNQVFLENNFTLFSSNVGFKNTQTTLLFIHIIKTRMLKNEIYFYE